MESMKDDGRNEERLSALLRSVSTEPDSAAWSLAIGRLRASDQPPRWLAWALRPAALGTAAALLLCSTAASWWLLQSGSERANLSDQVMAAAGASTAPDLDLGNLDSSSPAGARAVRDSGGIE
jgi:hypothetical protein